MNAKKVAVLEEDNNTNVYCNEQSENKDIVEMMR